MMRAWIPGTTSLRQMHPNIWLITDERGEQVAEHGAVAVVGGEEGLRAFGATAGGDAMEVQRVLPYL